MKGDFTHSIGEVVSVSDYEEMAYQFDLIVGVPHRVIKMEPEKDGTGGPKRVEEEKLGMLRESSHG